MKKNNPPERRPLPQIQTAKPTDTERQVAKEKLEMFNVFITEHVSKISEAKGAEVSGAIIALVWLNLFRNASLNGYVQTAQSFIAKRIGCGDKQVQRAVKWLKANRYLKQTAKGNKFNAVANTYRVRLANTSSQ